VEVPFRLTRRDAPAAAPDAFLLFAEGARALAAAVVSQRGAASPNVYLVHGGFLLLTGDNVRPPGGAIRLRRISGDLFVPIDANLCPALLPDEVVALTQDRGLIVLPSGEILAYDPTCPLTMGRWLAPARILRTKWTPLPTRALRPESLTKIERPTSPTAALDVLGQGKPDGFSPLHGPGEGSSGSIPDDARPPSGPPFRKIIAGAGFAAGALLAWLARLLHAPGLARRGGDLARRAVERIPRLTERILGSQEAALREVLRQLQSGDIEKGLRRAPIAVPDPDQAARIATDARLFNRDPRYSLRDLIASGGGSSTAWLGGGDVWSELAREYRRLAQEASTRGDYRRAAYLHGILLRDLRTAANSLLAGGLFRDAALLFRDRLNDPVAAAGAFEQAGDYDEALRLYEKSDLYERAGELLRRIGDPSRAVAYFTRAANLLVSRGQWCQAGDLMRRRAERRDLAIEYYQQGWAADTIGAVTCGQRLLDEHLIAGDLRAMHSLFEDAESRLAGRTVDTAQFFNYALRVGEDFLERAVRDDLTDRVKLIFAKHLSRSTSSAEARRHAIALFGSTPPWSPPVSRDAVHAAREICHPASNVQHSAPARLARGRLRAVAVARQTSDIVLATDSEIVCWRVAKGNVVPVMPIVPGGVVTLSTDSCAEVVYLLNGDQRGFLLRCFVAEASGSFSLAAEERETGEFLAGSEWYLQPTASVQAGKYRVTLAGPGGRVTFIGPYLQRGPADVFPTDGRNTYLLVETGAGAWDWDERFVRYIAAEKPEFVAARWVPHWSPAASTDGLIATPQLDWLTPEPGVLEIVGIDRESRIYWSEFDARNPTDRRSRTVSCFHPDGYRSVCLVDRGAIVAVTKRNEVFWLRLSGVAWRTVATTRLEMPSPVAVLIPRTQYDEVVAVFSDASAVRLPRPARP
jgi:tetratricopeptide (TPR) repeat protein